MQLKTKNIILILFIFLGVFSSCKVQNKEEVQKLKPPPTDSEYVIRRFEKLKNIIGSTDELIKLPKVPLLKGEYYCLTRDIIPVSHKYFFYLKEGKVELLNKDNLYKFRELFNYNEELSETKVDSLIEFIQYTMYNGTSGPVLNSIDDIDKKILKGMDEKSISFLKSLNISPLKIQQQNGVKEITCFIPAGYLYLLTIKIEPQNSSITYKKLFNKPVEEIISVQ